MTWFTRSQSRQRAAQAHARRPSQKRTPLSLERLEERTLLTANVFVVPLAVPLDATHFHALTAALPAAGTLGRVTIEPGAIPDPGAVTVTQGAVVIRGDPNIPGDILPSYDINVNASGVSLLNLRLGTVTIGAGVNTTTVKHTLVYNINETAAVSGNGSNTITQNQITGNVFLNGNSGFAVTDDIVTFNAFASNAGMILYAQNEMGLLIQSNSFIGSSDYQQAIRLQNSGTAAAPVVIANNTISLTGTGVPDGIDVTLPAPLVTFARIVNNTINTGNQGIGLILDPGYQANFSVLVQGNDFHGDKFGVYLLDADSNNANVNADLGGGSLGSLGGNDFRGFTTLGTQSSAAIVLFNISSGATLPARNNIFGAAPNLVIDDSVSGAATGTGVIDVSSSLSAGRAFVQALYNDALGRSGTLAELDGWLAIPNVNQAVIVNGILRSREALGRVVDGYYLQYLGRQSDAGREGWINLLQSGVSAENVQAAFLSSPEFLGHIDTDYVQALYRLTLGRTGAAAELAGWYTVLPQLGLQGVAAAFTNSAEHRSQVVAGDFLTLLHRPASAAELSSLTGLPMDLLTLEAAVLSSPEFFTNG